MVDENIHCGPQHHGKCRIQASLGKSVKINTDKKPCFSLSHKITYKHHTKVVVKVTRSVRDSALGIKTSGREEEKKST